MENFIFREVIEGTFLESVLSVPPLTCIKNYINL